MPLIDLPRWSRSVHRSIRTLMRYNGRTTPERNPLALCLFFALSMSMGPPALGFLPVPPALEPAGWVGQLAVTILWAGAVFGVGGILWPRRWYGLAGEFMGTVWVGAALLFYATIVIRTDGWGYWIAWTTAAGIGAGCFARAVQILLFVRERTHHG